MMAKQEFVLNRQDGKKQMIFMPHAHSAGGDTWKVFANIAKQEKVKPLEVRATENKMLISINKS